MRGNRVIHEYKVHLLENSQMQLELLESRPNLVSLVETKEPCFPQDRDYNPMEMLEKMGYSRD